MALRGTSATLTQFVSRSYCDPWRFSAIWTDFAIVVEAPASEMEVLTSPALPFCISDFYNLDIYLQNDWS